MAIIDKYPEPKEFLAEILKAPREASLVEDRSVRSLVLMVQDGENCIIHHAPDPMSFETVEEERAFKAGVVRNMKRRQTELGAE